MAGPSHCSNMPLQSFQLANQIQEVDPQDAIFKHDAEEDKRINREAPWKKEYDDNWLTGGDHSTNVLCFSPHYFKKCKISATALIKMVSMLAETRVNDLKIGNRLSTHVQVEYMRSWVSCRVGSKETQ